jgi:hypothetical protein
VDAFYDRLQSLRDALAAIGLDTWSEQLLTAERSASTSGEAIDNVSLVLRRLEESNELRDDELRQEVRAIQAEGKRLWNSAT